MVELYLLQPSSFLAVRVAVKARVPVAIAELFSLNSVLLIPVLSLAHSSGSHVSLGSSLKLIVRAVGWRGT